MSEVLIKLTGLWERRRGNLGKHVLEEEKKKGKEEQSQGKATRTSTSVTEPCRQPALPWRCGRPWQGLCGRRDWLRQCFSRARGAAKRPGMK